MLQHWPVFDDISRVDRRHIAAGHFHERPPSPSSWPGSMPLWPVGEHNEIHPPWTRSECAHSSNGFWPAQAKDESAKKPANTSTFVQSRHLRFQELTDLPCRQTTIPFSSCGRIENSLWTRKIAVFNPALQPSSRDGRPWPNRFPLLPADSSGAPGEAIGNSIASPSGLVETSL